MKWTDALPTKPGYYWCQSGDNIDDVFIVKVDASDYPEYSNSPDKFDIWHFGVIAESHLKDFVGCKWCGPIQRPSSGKNEMLAIGPHIARLFQPE
jgi:hypothetical protein